MLGATGQVGQQAQVCEFDVLRQLISPLLCGLSPMMSEAHVSDATLAVLTCILALIVFVDVCLCGPVSFDESAGQRVKASMRHKCM